jgi:hypothetical protein
MQHGDRIVKEGFGGFTHSFYPYISFFSKLGEDYHFLRFLTYVLIASFLLFRTNESNLSNNFVTALTLLLLHS